MLCELGGFEFFVFFASLFFFFKKFQKRARNWKTTSFHEKLFTTLIEESDANMEVIKSMPNKILPQEAKDEILSAPRLNINFTQLSELFMNILKQTNSETQSIKQSNRNLYYEYIEKFKASGAGQSNVHEAPDLSLIDRDLKRRKAERRKNKRQNRRKRKHVPSCDDLLEEEAGPVAKKSQGQLVKDSMAEIQAEIEDAEDDWMDVDDEDEAEANEPAKIPEKPKKKAKISNPEPEAETPEPESQEPDQSSSIEEDMKYLEQLEAELAEQEEEIEELENAPISTLTSSNRKKKQRKKLNKKRMKMIGLEDDPFDGDQKSQKAKQKLDKEDNDDLVLLKAPKRKKMKIQKQHEMNILRQQIELQNQLYQDNKKSMYADMQNSNKMNTTLEIESFMDSVSDDDLKKKKTKLKFAMDRCQTKSYEKGEKLNFKPEEVASPNKSPVKSILRVRSKNETRDLTPKSSSKSKKNSKISTS